MANILLVLHDAFAQKLLAKSLEKSSHVQVVTIPSSYSKTLLENASTIFDEELAKMHLTATDIDVILVEANYGNPSNENINTDLFNLLFTIFPIEQERTHIIAYSSTIPALVHALLFNRKMLVMSKGGTEAQLLSEISYAMGKLPLEDKMPLVERIYSHAKLKKLLEDIATKSPISRARSFSDPFAAPSAASHSTQEKEEETSAILLRHNSTSSISFMPLYDLSATSVPSLLSPSITTVTEPSTHICASSCASTANDSSGLEIKKPRF